MPRWCRVLLCSQSFTGVLIFWLQSFAVVYTMPSTEKGQFSSLPETSQCLLWCWTQRVHPEVAFLCPPEWAGHFLQHFWREGADSTLSSHDNKPLSKATMALLASYWLCPIVGIHWVVWTGQKSQTGVTARGHLRKPCSCSGHQSDLCLRPIRGKNITLLSRGIHRMSSTLETFCVMAVTKKSCDQWLGSRLGERDEKVRGKISV